MFRLSEFVGLRIKGVYSTRAMLKEVEILPTLVISTLRGRLVGFLACDKTALFRPYIRSGFWDWFLVGKRREFGLMSFIKVVAAFVNLMLVLNQPIRTSTAQVMVHFAELPQLRLFICLCPDFEIDFSVDFILILGLIWDRPMAGLVVRFEAVMAYFETVLVAGLVAYV